MKVTLTVTDGPHAGREFAFAGRDSFLVGRSKDAHFQLSYDDPYFSRRHFVVEVNPPRCRLLDLKSRNGVSVNGSRASVCELRHGDEVRAGHTLFRVAVSAPDPDSVPTLDLPAAPAPDATVAHSAAPPPEAAGGGVPGYRLGVELGRGGMGVVYRAVREADGVPAAVKLITPSPGAGGRAVERFLREARILCQLRHPHVVRFLEAGEAGDKLLIAMELVAGTDAARLSAARGPLPVATAVRIVCQALAGLAHAHAAGYVHRDVKPHNVLLGGPKGARTAKVADFGLARAFEASRLSGLTLNGEVGGTPAFMAPEQVTHFRGVTPAADQYAAAATLYYLLAGRNAFDLPRDVGAALVMILTDPPVPLRDRRPELPAGLAAVVHKAMARDPADRYPDATACRAALAPFAS